MIFDDNGLPRDTRGAKTYSHLILREDIVKYLKYNADGTLTWVDHYHPTHRQHLVGREAGTICKKGYKEVTFLNKKIRVHNIVWFIHNGKWPSFQIDHINREKLDNRIDNLRDVSHLENMQNVVRNSESRARYLGVTLSSQKLRNNHRSLYVAVASRNGSRVYLGNYHSAVIAATVRDIFVIDNNVERKLNFPILLTNEELRNDIRQQIFTTKT